MAREFADAVKADAVIVNGDLAINGPDSDAEIAFAAAALGTCVHLPWPCLATTT